MKSDTGKTLLIVGGGLLAAYLLFPKVKETVQEGIAGAIPSLEWGGIGLGEPGSPGIDLAGMISGAGTAAGEAAANAVKDAFASFFGGLTGGGGETPPPITPPEVTETEPSTWEYVKGEAVKIAEFGAIVTGGYLGARYLAPPVLRETGSLTGRVLSRMFPGRAAAQRAASTVKPGAGGVEGLGPASATKGFPLKYTPEGNWFTRLFKGGGGLTASTAYGIGLMPSLLMWQQLFPNIFAGHWGLPAQPIYPPGTTFWASGGVAHLGGGNGETAPQIGVDITNPIFVNYLQGISGGGGGGGGVAHLGGGNGETAPQIGVDITNPIFVNYLQGISGGGGGGGGGTESGGNSGYSHGDGHGAVIPTTQGTRPPTNGAKLSPYIMTGVESPAERKAREGGYQGW